MGETHEVLENFISGKTLPAWTERECEMKEVCPTPKSHKQETG